MKIRLSMFAASIAGFTILAGCSTAQLPAGGDGKTGVVYQIYSRQDLRYKAPWCLYTLTPEQMAAGTYVRIRVAREIGYKYFEALVPPAMTVQTGDQVVVTSAQCERNAIPQVTRVLRATK
ncbi:hypothetical protein LPB67_16110 [Undibacterium sp. Jales W-56]|uniref:hypothetical protein n=1 Tax=Undibacterium sp. Jales W-56 TaxID=2897325 RepID=UPI0021D275C3|nr:hypothetical protein [Undibacterium sp. Jales W-56]MCU6435301.1 hypothetical protein [Undibacterium sp. Jales W-56]